LLPGHPVEKNTMPEERPLILFTNDDGIDSPGLWAAVKALEGLGDRLVVAPRVQQSGTGRSLSAGGIATPGRIYPVEVPTGETWIGYSVDGTPARSVQHGVFEVADRRPSLVVSGINYGDNTGNGVTISGTVGAALEGASMGIPSLAISQQTPQDLHLTYSTEVDFDAAAHFTRYFGRWLLETNPLPDDLDLLKVDVPVGATVETPWKISRLSRNRTYWPVMPERSSYDEDGDIGYQLGVKPLETEPDSDIYTLWQEKIVSVTPMSLDMTARTNFEELRQSIDEHSQGR
jgi:5'-nucleotidase